jgi:hypothetical protein
LFVQLLLHDHLLNSVLQSFRSIMEQNYLGRNNLGKIAQNVGCRGLNISQIKAMSKMVDKYIDGQVP